MAEMSQGFVSAVGHGEALYKKQFEGIDGIDWKELEEKVVATINYDFEDFVSYALITSSGDSSTF